MSFRRSATGSRLGLETGANLTVRRGLLLKMAVKQDKNPITDQESDTLRQSASMNPENVPRLRRVLLV